MTRPTLAIILAVIAGATLTGYYVFSNNVVFNNGLPQTHYYYISTNSTATILKDSTNNIIASSTTPDSVFNTALTGTGNDIFVGNGTYTMSASFTGFYLKSNTQLTFSQGAKIIVPSGFSRFLFAPDMAWFNDASGKTEIFVTGGQFVEANPKSRLWTGIEMNITCASCGSQGLSSNYFNNMVFTDVGTLIKFDANGATNGNTFANGNFFSNIQAFNYINCIDMEYVGTNPSLGSSGFNGNTFSNLLCEASNPTFTGTQNGTKNLDGYQNVYNNIQLWDLPNAANAGNILRTAKYTTIIGWFDTTNNNPLRDRGSNTIIINADNFGIKASKMLIGTNVTASTTVQLQIVDNNTRPTFLQSDEYSNVNTMVVRRAEGTQGNPANTVGGNSIFNLLARDFVNNAFTANNNAAFQIFALNGATASDQSTYMLFGTTPSGSTSRGSNLSIGKDGAGSIDTLGYNVKIGSGKLLMSNPAYTNSIKVPVPAITSNVTRGIQYIPSFNQTQPGNGTGTSSNTPVQLSRYATLTPFIYTNATVEVWGYATSGTLLDGCKLSIRYGTSFLGGNGTPQAGTQMGANWVGTSATNNAKVPFMLKGYATGLTLGAKNYFDLTEGSDIGGTCTVFNPSWTVSEGIH